MRVTPCFRTFYIVLFLIVGVLLGSSLQSCSGNRDSEDTDTLEDYYEFKAFDLTDYELPATIMLPDETASIGASTKPEVLHKETDFYWDISVGQNFQIHIEDYGDNKDLVVREKNKLADFSFYDINYWLEEDNLIIYEKKLKVRGNAKAPNTVGVEHVSYHVYGCKEINGVFYELRSRDEGVEKPIVELMAKSIRSFQPK